MNIKRPGEEKMKIGACTCVWCTNNLSLDVAVSQIKEADYEGVAPFWFMVRDYCKGNPVVFRDLVQRYSLKVPAVLLLHETMENYKKAIDFLAESGTTDTFIYVTHPKAGRKPGKAMAEEVELVKELLDYVSDKGKRLTIHTHAGGFVVQERKTIDEFFDRLNDERLLLTFCCAQIAAAGETDLPDMLKTYKNRLFDVHFKDISHPGPWGDTFDARKDFLDVGDGIIDWTGVVKALKEIGFRGWLISDNDFTDDPLKYAKKTYGRISRLIEKGSL